MDYSNLNENGVPDAFENRLPISEILNQEDNAKVLIVRRVISGSL